MRFNKKEKGFTLIELVGVLVIIGLLNILFTQVFGQFFKDGKEKLYLKQLETIKMAAKAFTSDYKYLYPEDGDTINITLGQLKDTGYIDKNVVNPKTKKQFSDCMLIEISATSKDYNYDVKVDDIPAQCDRESTIMVSAPSKEFIKEKAKSTYIMTINIDSKLFSSYTVDPLKISLTGNTKSDKDIIGENGIYKLIIYGGRENGEVNFKFDPGSIIDEEGNDLTPFIPEFQSIMVDNIAPEIVFEPNGNSEYTRNQSFVITVNKKDNYSDLDPDTFKYAFSSNQNAETTLSFNNSENITNSNDSGTFYLIATACDKAENCANYGPSAFMLDNEKPIVNPVTVSSTNSSYNSKSVNISITGSDQYSGLSKLCIKDSLSASNLGFNDCTWLDIRIDNKYGLSLSGSEGSGNSYYIHVFMKDAAGNISQEKVSSKYTMYKYCDETGTTTYGTWGNCNASCGGGTQTRTETTYDKYFTSHVCLSGTGSKSCNTQSCCAYASAPAINCVPDNAYVIMTKSGGGERNLPRVQTGTCDAYFEFYYVRGSSTPDGDIFSISNSTDDSYSIIDCDDKGNCSSDLDSISWTNGNCMNGWCRREITVEATNCAGSSSKTFTYWLKYNKNLKW